jgi:hypothetical protein
MPVLVKCPYCGQGKVQAPDSAIGLTVVCRFCSSCFTIAPDNLMPAAVAATEVVEAAPRPRVPDASKTAEAALTILTVDPLEEVDRRSAGGQVASGFGGVMSDPGFVPALIAITLGGIGLGASQLPYGRFATVGLGAIGLFFGVSALLMTNRRKLPAFATAINGLALLLGLLLPEWLGITSWRPIRLNDETKTPRAVNIKDGLAAPADWVDVTKAAWERDDVRVSVTSFTVYPIELIGPKNKQQWTKESYVQVRVKVENVGVARAVDVSGWPESPTPDGPKLTDANGRVLPLKVFPEGWSVVERPKPNKVLFPGRSTEQLLIFESPGKTAGDLRLELPASAFGGTESVRLLLPR